jgi:protease-4
MALDAEMIADRSRMRRKLSFWRVAAILALILAVIVGGLVATGGSVNIADSRPQIARISVGGFIAGDQRMTDLFKQVGDSPSVSGVVISINSPGGTTTGSEELFRGIRDLSAKKPLVAFVDGTAASGAYITALAADRIVARETSIVGSIGVLFQYPDFSGVLGKIGVGVEEVKSSPLKAEPSGFHPTTPEARAALQAVVNDTYAWFKNLVAERRKMTPDQLAAVSDGRIFSARQGVSLRLVDALGNEADAVAWLEKERGVSKGLPVRDWKPRAGSGFTLWSAAAFGADLVGYDRLAGALRRADGLGAAGPVDGLLAVWQPQQLDR